MLGFLGTDVSQAAAGLYREVICSGIHQGMGFLPTWVGNLLYVVFGWDSSVGGCRGWFEGVAKPRAADGNSVPTGPHWVVGHGNGEPMVV